MPIGSFQIEERRFADRAAVDAVDHERHDHGNRRNRHDLGPEIEPAGEPAQGPVRQPLRPLVDGARDREVAGEFREHQGDDELADDDDGPDQKKAGPACPIPTPKLPYEPVETLMKLNAIAKFDRKPSVRLSSGLIPRERKCASSRAA